MSGLAATGPHREGVELSLAELLAQRRRWAGAGQRQRELRSRGPQRQRARALGRGLDFDELRSYQPGDEPRFIDWKTTARRGSVHTKVFREERERPVLLWVDLRAPLRCGSRVAFKSVLGARLAAAIAWRASERGDRVGAVIHGERRQHLLRPRGGPRGVARLAAAMVAAHAEPAGGSSGAAATAMAELARVAQSGSELWLLSDFHDWGAAAERALGRVARRAVVQALHLVDPLDYALPAAAGCVVSDGRERRLLARAGSAEARRYGEEFERRASALGECLALAGARYHRLDSARAGDGAAAQLRGIGG